MLWGEVDRVHPTPRPFLPTENNVENTRAFTQIVCVTWPMQIRQNTPSQQTWLPVMGHISTSKVGLRIYSCLCLAVRVAISLFEKARFSRGRRLEEAACDHLMRHTARGSTRDGTHTTRHGSGCGGTGGTRGIWGHCFYCTATKRSPADQELGGQNGQVRDNVGGVRFIVSVCYIDGGLVRRPRGAFCSRVRRRWSDPVFLAGVWTVTRSRRTRLGRHTAGRRARWGTSSRTRIAAATVVAVAVAGFAPHRANKQRSNSHHEHPLEPYRLLHLSTDQALVRRISMAGLSSSYIISWQWRQKLLVAVSDNLHVASKQLVSRNDVV